LYHIRKNNYIALKQPGWFEEIIQFFIQCKFRWSNRRICEEFLFIGMKFGKMKQLIQLSTESIFPVTFFDLKIQSISLKLHFMLTGYFNVRNRNFRISKIKICTKNSFVFSVYFLSFYIRSLQHHLLPWAGIYGMLKQGKI